MEERNIYQDIAQRTNGDIYIGVVGPVRSGKSTFIKRFMDNLVIPNMDSSYKKERAVDELPQSAAGRTIMTTEPKFIPENAVEVHIGENASFKVRLIDCVGYIVPSSLGYIENEQPRMVMTPWFEEPIPFNMAAELGTKKVITDHSTIGLVITTDGTISDIPREEYEEAEERVINELKEIKKQITEPYSAFEKQEKELIGIVNKAITNIDTQIKGYEEATRQEKLEKVKEIYAKTIGGLADVVTFDKIFKESWLNVSTTFKSITKEITEIRDKVDNDLFVINADTSSFAYEMKEEYLKNFDLTAAINKKQKLEETAKQKAIYEEQLKQEEQQRKQRSQPKATSFMTVQSVCWKSEITCLKILQVPTNI